MGHEVAPVRNNWLRRQYFGHLLRTEQSWLLALLGNSEDVAPATGSETEFGVFQNDPLLPAHAAGQSVVAELQRLFPGQATPELVRANGEVLTVEQPLANGTPFGSTLADLTRKLGAAQNAAQRHGARIGLVGFPGTWGLAYNGGMRGLLVPMKRYETYVKRMPSWDLTIPGIDGPIHVHAETVGGVGGCLAFQFTLDVPETQLHRFYDAASVWAGLHRALMPNTPFAFGRESRMHDSRWDVFTTGTRFDNRYRTFVGPTWTHSPQGVMEAIFGQVGRRSVFLDASRKNVGSAHKKLLSCTFPAARPRVGRTGRIYLEFRVGSSGPTAAHMVMQAALGIGVVAWLAARIDGWREHVPFIEIQRNLARGAYGPFAELTWYYDGRICQASAISILERILPAVYRALTDGYGIIQDDVELALHPAERLIATRQTGADVQRLAYRNFRQRGHSCEDALREATRLYMDASDHGTSTVAVADWNIHAALSA